MRHLLAALLVICLAASAQAQTYEPRGSRFQYLNSSTGSVNLLSGVALNASAGTRTITLLTGGWKKVSIFVQFTYNAATDVRLTCSASGDAGTNYGPIQTSSIASGTATLSDLVDVKAVTASKKFVVEYDVTTYDRLQCVFSGTSAGGSDLITVQAIAGTN